MVRVVEVIVHDTLVHKDPSALYGPGDGINGYSTTKGPIHRVIELPYRALFDIILNEYVIFIFKDYIFHVRYVILYHTY